MSDNVINSLKRLERAGSDDSRSTAKLIEAAQRVADHVADQIGFKTGHTLYDFPDATDYIPDHKVSTSTPVRYCEYAVQVTPQGNHKLAVAKSDELYMEVSDNWGREDALRFAQDIANGLLGEIANWLEDRSVAADRATTVLEEIPAED